MKEKFLLRNIRYLFCFLDKCNFFLSLIQNEIRNIITLFKKELFSNDDKINFFKHKFRFTCEHLCVKSTPFFTPAIPSKIVYI